MFDFVHIFLLLSRQDLVSYNQSPNFLILTFMALFLRLHDSLAEIKSVHLRWSHTGWSVCCSLFPNFTCDYGKLFCVVLGAPSVQMPVGFLMSSHPSTTAWDFLLQAFPPLVVWKNPYCLQSPSPSLLAKLCSWRAWSLWFSFVESEHGLEAQGLIAKRYKLMLFVVKEILSFDMKMRTLFF